MLDATAAEASDRSPAAGADIGGARRRRRALVACAALALALHAAFLGEVGSPSTGAAADPTVAPMSVRAVEAEPEHEPAPAAVVDPVAATPPAPPGKPRPPRRAREPTPQSVAASATGEEAGTRRSDPETPVAVMASEAASAALPPVPPLSALSAVAPAVVQASSAAPARAPVADSAEAALLALAASTAASAAVPALLAAGEQPPPTYRTRLPPPATLRYQVRRGFLRGTGEIRWHPSGDGYRLVLEARIAGLTLLVQTSEGGIDATGLAPLRFLDQRARRPAQAANFRRDVGTVTFSGPAVEWPLLAGSQDRLSWMIQLAGIAAAEPELLVDGGRISMIVVGARGEASVWTLRYAGRENVETAWGTVHAIKLVRDGRAAYDTSAEIWLDPERDYFPAHATLRNSSGASEYDLLLERVEPP
jgi:hypothetical protein